MPKSYVEAAEGERLKVTIQRRKEVSTPVMEYVVKIIDGVPQPVTSQIGTKVETQWIDETIVGPFASEKVEFEVTDDQRLLVEQA